MCLVALALASTSLAYLIYFRLIAELGAPSALTVTFLVPVFGVLWGALFLGEALHARHARRRRGHPPERVAWRTGTLTPRRLAARRAGYRRP